MDPQEAQDCWNRNVFSLFLNCNRLLHDCLISVEREFHTWGPDLMFCRADSISFYYIYKLKVLNHDDPLKQMILLKERKTFLTKKIDSTQRNQM